MSPAKQPIKIVVYESRSKDPKQRWRWKAIAGNGKKIANGGEGYVRPAEAAKMANYIVREAHPDAVTSVFPLRLPSPTKPKAAK